MACAFDPVTPNADTAARRGPAPRSQVVVAVGTKNRVPSASISGFHRVKCRFAGMTPSRTASAALIRPSTPAALSGCPMLVLSAPSAHGTSDEP
jgi:hypothetical protein